MFWKCRDKKIKYGKSVALMGIVNITPDSFSDGGDYFEPEKAVSHALSLLSDGADIIDLGAQSTRPGYKEIDEKEEWERIKPVLTLLRDKTQAVISVDTYFPYVAKNALSCGADVINDVSSKVNKDMAELIKKYGAGWVIMHSGAGSVNEVGSFFKEALAETQMFGINKEQICFDMGIGFGKSYEQNLELIANIPQYKIKDMPLMLAVSRKRVIGTASAQCDPKKRIYGNIAADTAAILGGADIIRVHDIKNEIQGVRTAEEIKRVWIK